MIKVPDMKKDSVSAVFGSASHLPKWECIPEAFKRYDFTYWNKFINRWLFFGIEKKVLESLIPKQGVDKIKALKAITAILHSFEPKHEHKEAGAAFLMSEWFENPEEIGRTL